MDPRLGLLTSLDRPDTPIPGVGKNRYAYSFKDPVNRRDPGGNMVVVTDQDGNDLFSLNDGLDDITRMTSSEAYDRKIQ